MESRLARSYVGCSYYLGNKFTTKDYKGLQRIGKEKIFATYDADIAVSRDCLEVAQVVGYKQSACSLDGSRDQNVSNYALFVSIRKLRCFTSYGEKRTGGNW